MLRTVEMDDRGALIFSLSGGQEIRLGREAHEARLDRFFAVAAPALETELDRIRYIDLRYPNGFAVGWAQLPRDGVTQLAQADADG